MESETNNIKPSLPVRIPPFDAMKGCVVPFTWTGEQCAGSCLQLQDSESNNITYNQAFYSNHLCHKIPADTQLVNGKVYSASLSVLTQTDKVDEQGRPILKESAKSNSVPVHCYTTPTFRFNLFADKDILGNSVLDPQVYYFQKEGEPLDHYQVSLYSNTKKLLYESPVYYSTSVVKKLNGLENGAAYYVRAVGETTNGMPLDTGYVEIKISYNMVLSNTILKAENMYDKGVVKISTDIKTFDYDSDNALVNEQEGTVDLRNGCINYNDGILLSNHFVTQLTVYDPVPNSSIISLSNNLKEKITISYYLNKIPTDIDGETLAYCYLDAEQDGSHCIAATPFFPVPKPDDRLDIYLKRTVDGLYSLSAGINGVLATSASIQEGEVSA